MFREQDDIVPTIIDDHTAYMPRGGDNQMSFYILNPEEFPEWHNSDTAKLFSPPIFENKKSNKGYWF